MLVMALDVGTSSARAACFDADARPLPGAEGRVSFAPRAAPDIIEALAKECDVVFAGSAD